MRGGDQEGRTAPGRGRTSTPRRQSKTAALIDAIFPSHAVGAADGIVGADLQTLISGAVRDLVRRTAASHACAWLAHESGAPHALAAYRKDGPSPLPDPAAFAALLQLPRASDLGEPGLDPALARLAEGFGLAAAAPLRAERERTSLPAVGMLLLGGPDDRPGRVRPRTLALLDEVAAELSTQLAAVDAAARIERLDDAVRRLDRLSVLGDLVAEIVHEVRNPLVSVKTFLQLLPERLHDPEFHGEFRTLVVDEVARLERLLDSVLHHASPQREETHTAASDVAEAFSAVIQLVGHRARERRLDLRQKFDPRVGQVAMARDALRQLLLNLVLNALDVGPPETDVLLEARTLAGEDGRFVELSVSDRGPGIPAAERDRIFEPFRSSRGDRPGGLGLAICRRLVREADGEIRIEGAAGGGARFSVRLRALPIRSRASSRSPRAGPGAPA